MEMADVRGILRHLTDVSQNKICIIEDKNRLENWSRFRVIKMVQINEILIRVYIEKNYEKPCWNHWVNLNVNSALPNSVVSKLNFLNWIILDCVYRIISFFLTATC